MILIILLMTQCTLASKRTMPEDINNQVIYVVDKEGVFIYDLNTKKTRKIYTTDQYILRNEMRCIQDNFLVVGHQSTPFTEEREQTVHISQDSFPEDENTTGNPGNINVPVMDTYLLVTDTFYAVHMDDGRCYKYMTVDYEYIEQQKLLKSRTILFDQAGTIINENNTIQHEIRMYTSPETIIFTPSIAGAIRGESRSNMVNGIQIFSSRGSLYLKNENDTVEFLPFDRPFDLKHMTGYYSPEISGDGKKLVVEYMEQFLSRGSVIVEIDLITREQKELIGYGYFKPKYSPDGQKIIMAKGHKITKKKTWVNTLYVFDIRTGKKTKIGRGIEYMWRTNHSIPQSL